MVSRRDGQARPTVMLIPTVMGVSDLELGFAKQLVELGYNAFVADIFGKKFRGAERDVMFGEMTRLATTASRCAAAARHRRSGARPASRSRTASWSSPAIASRKCALDVARTGTDIARQQSPSTACSTMNWPTEKTNTKVLAFHGWDDPMAPPDVWSRWARN